MKTKDFCLAIVVALIWGLNFSFIKLGVAHIDPFVLAGLRFTLTALPLVFWLPRPDIGWRWLGVYGLAFGVGTWGLVTLSLRAGLAPGLAAWLLQSSAFITPMLGCLWLGEVLTVAQKLGSATALLGLLGVFIATPGDTPALGLVLVMAAALALSIANVVVKRSQVKPSGILGFVAWSCLLAPLPLFALAYATAGARAFTQLPQQLNLSSCASLLFQVYPTTLLGYTVWNGLMARYSAAQVAPVALLVPVFAAICAWCIFGTMTSTGQNLGIALILLGLMTLTFGQRFVVMRLSRGGK